MKTHNYDQVFYNNAGKTKRSGLEFSGHYNYNNFLTFKTSISIGKYLFDEFIDNEKIKYWNDISRVVTDRPGKKMPVTFLRNGILKDIRNAMYKKTIDLPLAFFSSL